MSSREFGTIVSSPIVAGSDDLDDIASAISREIQGNFQKFETLQERDTWTTNYKSRLFESTCLVLKSGQDLDPVFFRWTGTTVDGSDGQWSEIVFATADSSSTTSGLTIGAGSVKLAGIEDLEIEGMILESAKKPGEADLKTAIEFTTIDSAGNEKTGQDGMGYKVKFEEPLRVYSDSNEDLGVIVSLKPGQFDQAHPPSFLAYLKNPQPILMTVDDALHEQSYKGALWFDDIIYTNTAPFVGIDKINKSYSIEEADTLDPNVSGGTDYLIVFRIYLDGIANKDGYVKLFISTNKTAAKSGSDSIEYLKDSNERDLILQKHFKKGQKLGAIELAGIVNAKGQESFSCHIVKDFEQTLIMTDRLNGASGLLIQALTKSEKTSPALLEFQQDSGQNIKFNSYYYGKNFKTLNYYVNQRKEYADMEPNSILELGNNYSIYAYKILSYRATSDKYLNILGNGGPATTSATVALVLGAMATSILANKDIIASIIVTDMRDNLKLTLSILEWVGIPGKETKNIYVAKPDGTFTPQDNWNLIKTQDFYSESNDIEFKLEALVPDTSRNLAIVISLNGAGIKLKQFNLSAKDPFEGHILQSPEFANEFWLDNLNIKSQIFQQDNQNFKALGYSIPYSLKSGVSLPCGVSLRGDAGITIDESLNVIRRDKFLVGGASDTKLDLTNYIPGEGALTFTNPGVVTMTTKLSISNPADHPNAGRFWWVMFRGGVESVIPGSEFTADVPNLARNSLYSYKFSFFAHISDKIYFKGRALHERSIYLLSDGLDHPLLANVIYIASESPIPDSSGTEDVADVKSDFEPVSLIQHEPRKYFKNNKMVVLKLTGDQIKSGIQLLNLSKIQEIVTAIPPKITDMDFCIVCIRGHQPADGLIKALSFRTTIDKSKGFLNFNFKPNVKFDFYYVWIQIVYNES